MDPEADAVTRLRQGTEASVRFMAEHVRFFALLDVERNDQTVAATLRESGDIYVQDAARVVQEAQQEGLVPGDHDPTLLAIGVLGAVSQFSPLPPHRTARPADRRARPVRGRMDGERRSRRCRALWRALTANLTRPAGLRRRRIWALRHRPQEEPLNSSGPAQRGWYRVPGQPGRLRWWDGARWTDDEFVLPGSEAESRSHHPTREPPPTNQLRSTAPDRVRVGRDPFRSPRRQLHAHRPGPHPRPAAGVVAGARHLLAAARLLAPVPYWVFAGVYLAAGRADVPAAGAARSCSAGCTAPGARTPTSRRGSSPLGGTSSPRPVCPPTASSSR